MNNQNLISTNLTGTVQEFSSNNIVTTFIIEKNQIGLDKLGIIYKAPEIEAQINFNIKVTSCVSPGFISSFESTFVCKYPSVDKYHFLFIEDSKVTSFGK